MAEDDSQEKTEEPSSRKLEQAAEDGKVLSSKEMFVFTTLSMAFLILVTASLFVGPQVKEWGNLFRIDQFQIQQFASVKQLQTGKLYDAFYFIIKIMIAIGIPMFIIVLFTQATVGGTINVSMKAMAFKGNKLNPLEGLKKMVSTKSLVELGKSVLKVVLLFGISGFVLYQLIPAVIRIPDGSFSSAIDLMQYAFPLLLGCLLCALFIIAIIDYFWQRHTHIKSLMMSRQDQKDEYKQTEGSPEVKQKIRRMQMETAANSVKQREALDDVKEATAIITNPTHFAVALKYNVGDTGAPQVLAMGRGKIAEEIRYLAKENKVPIFQSPLLARALYYTSEIGKEISEQLYTAVAVALAYIYRVDKGEDLETPDITVPEDLQFDENGKLTSGE